MVKTDTLIENMPKLLDEHCSKTSDAALERLVSSIEKLRSNNIEIYDEKALENYLKERAKTLRELIEQFYGASISNKFPVISSKLFDLKRHLILKKQRKVDEWEIIRDDTESEDEENSKRCPNEKKVYGGKRDGLRRSISDLFALTPLFDKDQKTTIGTFKKYEGYYSYTTKIEAKFPSVFGPNFKNQFNESLRGYFGILSRLFTEYSFSNLMYREFNFKNPEVGALWIPPTDMLQVGKKRYSTQIRDDLELAMVFKIDEINYLAGIWRLDKDPIISYAKSPKKAQRFKD